METKIKSFNNIVIIISTCNRLQCCVVLKYKTTSITLSVIPTSVYFNLVVNKIHFQRTTISENFSISNITTENYHNLPGSLIIMSYTGDYQIIK